MFRVPGLTKTRMSGGPREVLYPKFVLDARICLVNILPLYLKVLQKHCTQLDESLQSCPVLPTTVLDSSDSLTLSFQSWEDPGFLGHPRTLPSCPSQQAAHAVRRIPWDPPLVSLHRHRAPCCPEDLLDITGSSLHVPLTQLSGGSFGHPAIPRTSRNS